MSIWRGMYWDRIDIDGHTVGVGFSYTVNIDGDLVVQLNEMDLPVPLTILSPDQLEILLDAVHAKAQAIEAGHD